MAGYFYILLLQDDLFYYGSTRNLKQRMHLHINRRTSIKHLNPQRLLYFEGYETYTLARKREIAVKKNAAIRAEIKKRLDGATNSVNN